ncbi:hypothetical protein WR25_17075 [Diploscapter pachys]|uniref:Thioredoxin domain-containing protein n=1 Tax=Diploscapter pachys TaxID=2018661 RepID=A0A2A2L411_9BILA|nr:hypothetical protein WR25_17075 [Diploscapter pachys]
MKQITTEEELNSFVKSSDKLNVVHFFAPWAETCGQLNTFISDLTADLGADRVEAAFLDAEALPSVSHKHNINAVPTVVLFKNGTAVDRIDGFKMDEIRRKVNSKLGSADENDSQEMTKEDLNARLKKLIESHKLMLFMKGNKDAPKCGFSRQMTDLLNSVKVDYGTFDILSDEDVRQGLKSYSNWPTYPQLYLDGELLGGLDVVREELQDEDFVSKLPKVA